MHCLALILEQIHSPAISDLVLSFRQAEQDEKWTEVGDYSKEDLPIGCQIVLDKFSELDHVMMDLRLETIATKQRFQGRLQLEAKENASLRGITVLFLEYYPEQVLLITVTLKVLKMVPESMRVSMTDCSSQTEENKIFINRVIQTETIESEKKVECQAISTNTEDVVFDARNLEELMQRAIEKAVHERKCDESRGDNRRNILNTLQAEIEDPKPSASPQNLVMVEASENLDSKYGHNVIPRIEKLRQLDVLIKSKEAQFNKIQRDMVEVELNAKRLEILRRRTEEVKKAEDTLRRAEGIATDFAKNTSTIPEITVSSNKTEIAKDKVDTSPESSSDSESKSTSKSSHSKNSDDGSTASSSTVTSNSNSNSDESSSDEIPEEPVLSPTSRYLSNLRKTILLERQKKEKLLETL